MTGKGILSVILSITAIAFLIWGGMVVWRLFSHETLKSKVLATDFEITSDWKEVGSFDELMMDKDYRYISLQIEPPFEAYTIADPSKSGIKIPGGKIVNPEIKVVDAEENEYPLVYSGHLESGANVFVNYKVERGLPRDKDYQKVKLRSDFPMTVKAVLLSGYDQSDLK
ncbi:MAG: hypothetical protein R2682_14685 [Pyrinomonadaceae bacterium]